jgi:hypothetical protein
MQIIIGTICKLLTNSAGLVHGFSLDLPIEIYFPEGQSEQVLALIAIGSSVRVHASARDNPAADRCADATSITNLDSGRSLDLSLPTPHSPEVSTYHYAPPRNPTPLGPAFEEDRRVAPLATAREVADSIEQAHERLHRVQAILVHLNLTKQHNSGLAEYLDEAEHTFVQALARYEARDFEGAREYIAASASLCCLVEIFLSRTMRANDTFESPAQSLPVLISSQDDEATVQRDLSRVERLLARIRWVTQNGTLSSEDRTQVERLSSWGARLCHWAHRLLDTGANLDAIEFARAAEAAVSSAEHLCREGYVTRSAVPQRISAHN